MSEQLRMPFGKYKGQPFAEIPDDFYQWADKSGFKIESPNLAKQAAAFEAEKAKRLSGQSTQQKPPQSAPTTMQGYSLTQVKASVFAMKSAYRNSPAKQDVNDALDGLVSLLTEDEIGQARPAPTDGAPKKAYVDYPDPPEEEEEAGTEEIPF